MHSIKTAIKDVIVIEPKVFTDERGYFMETFRKEWLPEKEFIQKNESFSKKNVLRGLHYQQSPFAQAKLVRCVVGEVVDVAVDLRKASPTFGEHFKILLSGENKKQLFIPEGFAHGFLTLSDWALVAYQVDAYYAKDAEVTIRFDDRELAIDWGISEESIILSDKDKNAIDFSKANYF